MGETIAVNSSTQRVKPVGSVYLTNGPDLPEIFEFRGRIEKLSFHQRKREKWESATRYEGDHSSNSLR